MPRREQEMRFYLDGAEMRMKNRRIGFKVKESGDVEIYAHYADENPDKPACSHRCVRNKVRVTHVQLTDEAMQAISYMYLKWKSDPKNPKNQK